MYVEAGDSNVDDSQTLPRFNVDPHTDIVYNVLCTPAVSSMLHAQKVHFPYPVHSGRIYSYFNYKHRAYFFLFPFLAALKLGWLTFDIQHIVQKKEFPKKPIII